MVTRSAGRLVRNVVYDGAGEALPARHELVGCLRCSILREGAGWLDADYKPKPSFERLMSVRRRWKTSEPNRSQK